jgi:hypothetical protein
MTTDVGNEGNSFKKQKALKTPNQNKTNGATFKRRA